MNNPWEEEERIEEEERKNYLNGYYANLEILGVTDKDIIQNQNKINDFIKKLFNK